MLVSHRFDLSQTDIAKIVTQASSLSERLSNGLFEIDATQVDEPKFSDELLDHWCQVVAQGNREKFQKRLLWAGWDIDTVRLSMGALRLAGHQALPSWTQTLTEIIQTAADFIFEDEFKIAPPLSLFAKGELKSKVPIDPNNPLPFEDLLLPFVYVARQKLLTCLGSESLSASCLPLELLDEEAYLAMERSLLSGLVYLCEKTLEFEFSRFRPFGYSFLNLVVKQIKVIPQKTHYKAFVQKLLQDELLAFFQKYPVLGKLIATRIDFWVEATTEFLQRLKADIAEIQQVFQPDQGSTTDGEMIQSPVSNSHLGKVIEIKPNLSDPHKRGRSVIALTFESGLKLIYKPKDLGLEVAYNQFLDWCNQQGVLLPFLVLKVLNRQAYGWVEYVEQQPCSDEAGAQRFYQRAGMLLCLLYVLGATDCHHENLIASGEHLVLVDMETLMQHEARVMKDSSASTAEEFVSQQFWDSVLRTGLLPCWDFNQDNRIAYDFSGLGSIDPQPSPSVPQWKFVNTDNMHPVYESITVPVQKNVPILNGVPLSPNNYLEELVAGFGQMYHFLLEQGLSLLASSGPLALLQDQQVRFIFRDSNIYAIVLHKTLVPELLQNGVDWSIELDILARPFLTNENKPNAWSILHSELRAMEQLDIPYFGAKSDSDTLTVGLEQPIEKYCKASSYSQVISKLQKLDETDLAKQVAIIQGAFYARVARLPETEQTLEVSTLKVANGEADTQTACSQISPLTSEQLLASAFAIAQEIDSHAIWHGDSSVFWIGLDYIPNVERFQFQFLDNSLYGNCGIALFLAALDYLRGSSQFRNLTLGALKSLQEVLQTNDTQLTQSSAEKIDIGGATGLGSIIYSLVKISHFLAEPGLIEDAQRVASFITPELIATDQKLDVMTGAAGTILGLLALYNETTQQAILDKAVACGQHLLEHRVSVDGFPKAWKTNKNQPLTGFSYGAAGIAYALLRLYSLTHDSTYLEAACEGINYERSVFSTTAANWPDFRSFGQQNGSPRFMVSWCHGAPGIGLGRLGGLSILETEEIHQDVEVALQTTQKYGLQGVDYLYCGNLGRCEVLLVAAQKLSRPQLLQMAQQKAAWVVARAEHLKAYQLFPDVPGRVYNPGFFQGTAGIGYELLRLAFPEILPSVLLWE